MVTHLAAPAASDIDLLLNDFLHREVWVHCMATVFDHLHVPCMFVRECVCVCVCVYVGVCVCVCVLQCA